VYVKNVFGDFYRAMFDREVSQEDMRVVFQEYCRIWAGVIRVRRIRLERRAPETGVFWLERQPAPQASHGHYEGQFQAARKKCLHHTHAHLRYERSAFPEDWFFRRRATVEFPGAVMFCGIPGRGPECPAAPALSSRSLPNAKEPKPKHASLTGWDIAESDKNGRERSLGQN